jgi:hypothetical protein
MVIIKIININEEFDSAVEAVNFLIQKNKDENLPNKNMIWEYENYLKVELTQGQFTKVNKNDLDIIESYIWFANPNRDSYYATTHDCNGTIYYLHRALYNKYKLTIDDDKTIDHINRDKLDNQLTNLRTATASEQMLNQNIRVDNTSGVKEFHMKNLIIVGALENK